MPEPGAGEMLIRVIWLSLDPYMRGRMDDAKSYATPVPIGGTMEGGTVAQVVTSANPKFAPGDYVLTHSGWCSHAGCASWIPAQHPSPRPSAFSACRG
jgi:NADPH-dependent curcumin reductase CurA